MIKLLVGNKCDLESNRKGPLHGLCSTSDQVALLVCVVPSAVGMHACSYKWVPYIVVSYARGKEYADSIGVGMNRSLRLT